MTHAVSATRLINASPEAIFDILATPSRHGEFDGSGTVQSCRENGKRVRLGDTFGMDMKMGLAYSTRNEVTAFREGRVIAWRTWAPAPLDKVVTGRTWRFELVPTDGGTLVTETWDPTTEKPLSRPGLRVMAGKTRTNIEKSLERLEKAVTNS